MKKLFTAIALLTAVSTSAMAEKVKPQDAFKFNTSTECMFQWKNAVMESKDPYWNTVDFDETGTPKMGDKYQYPVMKTFYYRSDTKASFITQTCQIDSTIWQYSYPEFIENMKKN